MFESQPLDIVRLVEKTKEQEPLKGESIVFDNGNTIVFDPFDDLKEEVTHKASQIALEKFAVTLDARTFLSAWDEANDKLNFPFASHFLQEEPFIQAALKAIGVDDGKRPTLALAILGYYRESFQEHLENDPRRGEIRDTLTELRKRGKHLAVLSNDRDFAARSMFAWLGIEDLFEHFLTSEEIGVEKPDPEVFKIASQRFGKPIQDIIYVGDDPERDVVCAHNAGAKAILYVPPGKFRSSTSWRDYSRIQQEPDATIENFRDLLGVIK